MKDVKKTEQEQHTIPNCIPLNIIIALNSSAVFHETTEEGRLFHKGITIRKKNFSEHHYRPCILCIVNHEMPRFFSWVLG